MRSVLLLLLAANIALFMWGRWYRESLVDARPPTPQREVAQEKVKLLSEPGVRLMLRKRREASRPALPAPAATLRCYRIGPFEIAERADAAGKQLDAWGLDYERLAGAETGPAAYHVYLPPFGTREAAERRRRELTRLGFTDHALIQEEGMENGVSLGVFAIEQNAHARAAQLARRGIKASIRVVTATKPVYWLSLVFRGREASGAPLERLAAADWGAAGVRLQPRSCASPASVRPDQPGG